MSLEDTVQLMLSDNYQDRLKAEYLQLDIRIESLKRFIDDYEHGRLEFEPKVPFQVFTGQLFYMENYRTYLLNRMQVEGITL